MPADKFIEERRQTQHKLELMERYWGAWCSILAQARRYPFCPTRLWLVDTHAGTGEHASTTDPDGKVEGTPVLAALAARNAQRRFPDVQVRVRATDHSESVARQLTALMRPYRGEPPVGVDVKVRNVDWVKGVSWVAQEIADEGHPHGGRPGRDGRHAHRSLWFIDPYGVESLEHEVIDSFPPRAEVIVNLDLMGLLRHAGKARRGDAAMRALLETVFRDGAWEAPSRLADPHQGVADTFANSFPRWRFRRAYLLRATGSQDRAMVHLTDSSVAVKTFARAVETAMKAGTIIAGRVLTGIEKDKAALELFNLFRGLTMTTRQMVVVMSRYSLEQVRPICRAAETNRYGHWDERTATMEWFRERTPEMTLFD